MYFDKVTILLFILRNINGNICISCKTYTNYDNKINQCENG